MLLVAGTGRPAEPGDTAFNKNDFKPYQGKGTSTIHGQTSTQGRGQFVVYLIPDTPYTRQLADTELNAGKWSMISDNLARKYSRKTKANPAGEFEFKKIPPGRYFLRAAVGDIFQEHVNGILFAQRVEVSEGATANATLSVRKTW